MLTVPEYVTPAPVKIAAESVPEVTLLLVSANWKNCCAVVGLVTVGALLSVATPVVALIAVTVVLAGMPGPVTVAPRSPLSANVVGSSVIVPFGALAWPGKTAVGKASVPVVPENVAQVVPGGTFLLLIATPAAIPVPLATDALEEPFVVVRVVLTDPQTAILNGPTISEAMPGPTPDSVPVMT